MAVTTVWQYRIQWGLGVWLLVSPMILGYGQPVGPAALNAYACGTAIALLALISLNRPRWWLPLLGVALGVWLIAAPLLLGYAEQTIPVWNQLTLAIVVGGGSLSSMALDGASTADGE